MPHDVLLPLTAILVLGLAAQWLASALRLPAILLLLLTGIAAGAGTAFLAGHHLLLTQRFLDPNALFGPLLLPAVSLAVAVILFEGGLSLNFRDITHSGRVITALVTLGPLVTAAVAIPAAHYLLRLDLPLATLLGAILVVTGPTVIGPLLRHVRPTGPVGPILRWEGIVIDPIGALAAVVVFEAVVVGEHPHAAAALSDITRTVLLTTFTGTAIGLAAAAFLILAIRRFWLPDLLQSPLALVTVLAAFTASNLLRSESGLFAVTTLGIALANQKYAPIHHIAEFKETLSVLLVSSLFIVLGARLRLDQITALSWRHVAFAAVLIFVARPLTIALCTLRSPLTWKQRAFLAALAPRGVVAAAVSSVFALRLREIQYPDAPALVPAVFAVIILSVTFYGLTIVPIARRLGVANPSALGFLIAGANPLARAIASALKDAGQEVLLVDTNPDHVAAARLAGLPVLSASIVSRYVEDRIALTGLGQLLALTPNAELNSLAAAHYARLFGRSHVYQLPYEEPHSQRKEKLPHTLKARALFDPVATYGALASRIANRHTIKRTPLTKEFTYENFKSLRGDHTALPLFLLTDNAPVTPFTLDTPPTPKPGQFLLTLQPSEPPRPPQPQ